MLHLNMNNNRVTYIKNQVKLNDLWMSLRGARGLQWQVARALLYCLALSVTSDKVHGL